MHYVPAYVLLSLPLLLLKGWAQRYAAGSKSSSAYHLQRQNIEAYFESRTLLWRRAVQLTQYTVPQNKRQETKVAMPWCPMELRDLARSETKTHSGLQIAN